MHNYEFIEPTAKHGNSEERHLNSISQIRVHSTEGANMPGDLLKHAAYRECGREICRLLPGPVGLSAAKLWPQGSTCQQEGRRGNKSTMQDHFVEFYLNR